MSGLASSPSAGAVRLPLSSCGCCEGAHALTPAVEDNPPGAASVRYRAGTAGAFLATMQAHAQRSTGLAGLRARLPSDPSVALLEAWAAVLDVLSFYSERIVNETYLRTATEPASLVQLARTLGYEPGPGRAASAWLSFTVDDTPGAPPLVPIPIGTKVASLPGPGEVPQTFETVAELDARPEWNAIAAATSLVANPKPGDTAIFIAGAATQLRPTDVLLFVGREREKVPSDNRWVLRTIAAVTPLPDAGVTRVSWVDELPEKGPAPIDTRVFVLRQRASLFGANAPDWRTLADQIRVHFYTGKTVPDDWPGFAVLTSEDDSTIDLDALYPNIVPGGWLVLTGEADTHLFSVVSAEADGRADFGISARTTRVVLDDEVPRKFKGTRRTTLVLAGSEQLTLAPAPLDDPVQGSVVDLARPLTAVPPGHTVIVQGRAPRLRVAEGVRTLHLIRTSGGQRILHPADILVVNGPYVAHGDGSRTWPASIGDDSGTVLGHPDQLEVLAAADDEPLSAENAVIAATAGADPASPAASPPPVTSLSFAPSLTGSYDRASVRIQANVAPATHGESKTEVLGSGDATIPLQSFTLSQTPLTFVPAAGGTGVASTLQIRVDGVLWTEMSALNDAKRNDQVYVSRRDEAGKVTVTFGDGDHGARLPTGSENVTATYRVGTGLVGDLPAGRLTMPLTRPLGLRAVTNPLSTGLAADPDSPDVIRRNTPKPALSIDRVVSFTDHEDFARARPGIAKARASWLLCNEVQVVHLTVAADGGQQLTADDCAAIAASLVGAGARPPVIVDAALVTTFDAALTLFVDPARIPGTVKVAVVAALNAAFGFDGRDLEQPVTISAVVTVAQDVPGVVAVTLRSLFRTGATSSLQAVVTAGTATSNGNSVTPAHLLLLRPDGLDVVEAI